MKAFVLGFAAGFVLVKLTAWAEVRFALAGLDERYQRLCGEGL